MEARSEEFRVASRKMAEEVTREADAKKREEKERKACMLAAGEQLQSGTGDPSPAIDKKKRKRGQIELSTPSLGQQRGEALRERVLPAEDGNYEETRITIIRVSGGVGMGRDLGEGQQRGEALLERVLPAEDGPLQQAEGQVPRGSLARHQPLRRLALRPALRVKQQQHPHVQHLRKRGHARDLNKTLNITSFYGSSRANNGKDALNIPDNKILNRTL
eukprot:1128655-Prorocentrum_minimum.AAC.1